MYRVQVVFCIAGMHGREFLNVEASAAEWAKHSAVSIFLGNLYPLVALGELTLTEYFQTTCAATSCVRFALLPAAERAFYLH